MVINVQKAQSATNYTKESAGGRKKEHIHECTFLTLTNTSMHIHTSSLTLRTCMCVCVNSHAGQSDVPSHICQHPEFIYSVILSFVDLVTWSESGRCRTPGTLESPVRTWWETRACDLTYSTTHTYTSSPCTLRPPAFSFHPPAPLKPFPLTFVTLYCPFLTPVFLLPLVQTGCPRRLLLYFLLLTLKLMLSKPASTNDDTF